MCFVAKKIITCDLIWILFGFCSYFVRISFVAKKIMWKRKFKNFRQNLHQIDGYFTWYFRSAWTRMNLQTTITILSCFAGYLTWFCSAILIDKNEDERLWFHGRKTDNKFQVLNQFFILISCSNPCDIQNLSFKKSAPKNDFRNRGYLHHVQSS